MKELEEKIVKFAEERDWLQFNTPENLAKSISIEAGELLECFQWNNDYDKNIFVTNRVEELDKIMEKYVNDNDDDISDAEIARVM